LYAIRAGKEVTAKRVERSLYDRANGYNNEAVKIFMPAGSKQPVIVHYTEHCPPDVGLRLFGRRTAVQSTSAMCRT
jgi:hypothetical protein